MEYEAIDMECIIRRMALEDYACVKQLWIDCGLSQEPEDSIEDVTEFLLSLQSAGFVAHENGKIEGAVLCGSDGRYGYIHHLAVAKLKRNCGMGRALVQACVSFLQRRHIIVMVRENNKEGNEFWNHLCFQQVDGLRIQYYRKGQ